MTLEAEFARKVFANSILELPPDQLLSLALELYDLNCQQRAHLQARQKQIVSLISQQVQKEMKND